MTSPEQPGQNQGRATFEKINEMRALGLQEQGQAAFISFSDTKSPTIDGGDPARHCTIFGALIACFETPEGMFVTVDVTSHSMQRVSTEAVAEGYTAIFDAYHGSEFTPDSVSESLTESAAFAEEYPETDMYDELLTARGLLTFRIEEVSQPLLSFVKDQ